jgi:hydroxymethylglutaryl-CoA lyase
MEPVHVVECPRDALQGWGKPVATEVKVAYYKALMRVGFGTLDFGSFVSPRHVPQMADTLEVIRRLDAENAWGDGTRRLVIVVNARGAEAACACESVDDIGFPLSLSETFSLRNAGMGRDAAWGELDRVKAACEGAGKRLVVYLSMGFGNPYGDSWSLDLLSEWTHVCIQRVCPSVISWSDTLGSATPDLLEEAFRLIRPSGWDGALGAHLHAVPSEAEEKVEATLRGGCRRIDAAMGGIGGCPFASDALVGNIATETLRHVLAQRGGWVPRSGQAWEDAGRAARNVFN